ncbi:MAG: transposase [Chlorobiales bacterium]|nr:transposase [Chlorobiales bacterium]
MNKRIAEKNDKKAPLPKRKQLRLPEYDYAQEGAYFITACTRGKACLFGNVVDGDMILNDAGSMVQLAWDAIPVKYPGIETDEFVVMPNHVHGIIVITDSTVGATPRGCPNVGDTQHDLQEDGQARGPAPTNHQPFSLPDVMHRFKSMTTNAYIQGVRKHGWKPFNGKLWQRNYFERVIRNERELNRIREYIEKNPLRWVLDRENPEYASHRERTHWGE